jgi:hypothetical protein
MKQVKQPEMPLHIWTFATCSIERWRKETTHLKHDSVLDVSGIFPAKSPAWNS